MTITNNGRVFLTDGVIRRTLAAARALGKEGVPVTCGEETRGNLTFLSRYCDNRFKYPSPRKKTAAFVAALVEYLTRNPHEVLMPMEQDSLDIILSRRADFEAVTRLPFVDNATYRVFRDKAQTVKLAEKIGIPHPKTVFPTNPNSLAEEVIGLKFPVVIKPRGNWASRGVEVAHNLAELETLFADVHAEFPFPLIQEKIPPGEQYHVCCLMDENSKLTAVCTQKELRHHPHFEGIGASTVQMSVDRPDLVDLTVQLLQANNWYGVANSDIMIDPRNSTPMLMEVNPRFWGPLQSSIHAGVNFPHLLYRLARGEKVDPVLTYKLGVINRSFLPYDILHFLSNPERFRLQPSFFDFFGENVHFDILSWRDPLPVLGFGLTVGRYLFDPEVWARLAHMERFGAFLAKVSGQEKITQQNPFDLQSKSQKRF
ncbi:ATP-grasp domain-containing protein [Candidatus Leptofilum sp.]|uniref:carboxylate--amine ligase n=1 Tax=Candidatus Leptofilum sp. TaxID=3241576 RepID=UPI003B5A5ACA